MVQYLTTISFPKLISEPHCPLYSHLCVDLAVERLLGRLDEGEGLVVARAPEVVVVDRPEHDAAEALLADVDGLVLHGVDVVVADPEVVLVRVGAGDAGVGPLHGPLLVLDALADLVVGEVAVLLGALALLAGTVGRGADLVRGGVEQGV